MCSNSYGVVAISSNSIANPSRFSSPHHPGLFFYSFKPCLLNPQISLRSRVGSFRLRASTSDGSVSSATAMSFYDLLGIPETGTMVEIKQAYKQLARKYHPDVSPPELVEENTRWFIRVQEAYKTLSDPGRRAMYDADMAMGLHFAFSARKNYQNSETMQDRSEWKSRWQSQLSQLKRRSMYKEANRSMSWGERVRRQREDINSSS